MLLGGLPNIEICLLVKHKKHIQAYFSDAEVKENASPFIQTIFQGKVQRATAEVATQYEKPRKETSTSTQAAASASTTTATNSN